MKVLCVIPARYASTRLPGKPLADINGKPMIQHVYERACCAQTPDTVLLAVDDERVYTAAKQFGAQVMMTDVNHNSGTDRLAEVAQHHPDVDIIVNVQGDEPLIPAEIIDVLVGVFEDADISMATLKCELPEHDVDNPAAVKVVTDCHDNALYFSRSPIPYRREQITGLKMYKHIGIYAYRRDFLLKYAQMPRTLLERVESLEQLRALENGYKIKVLPVEYNGVGVDTPADLEAVRQILK